MAKISAKTQAVLNSLNRQFCRINEILAERGEKVTAAQDGSKYALCIDMACDNIKTATVADDLTQTDMEMVVDAIEWYENTEPQVKRVLAAYMAMESLSRNL